MNYFEYKDALAGFLLLSYILYNIIVLSKSFILKKKSTEIIKVSITRSTIQNVFLNILTYMITIPLFAYYFSKVLRFLYLQFIDNDDLYLLRQGFYREDFDERKIVGICIVFYSFLIIKFVVSYLCRYTIRKDNFVIITLFVFLLVIEAWGKGNDIRTYSHEIITVFFFLMMYFVVRNKVIKDFH
jgi:hypothetical protein